MSREQKLEEFLKIALELSETLAKTLPANLQGPVHRVIDQIAHGARNA